jgi:DNA-binding transcriptional LysR family regulator
MVIEGYGVAWIPLSIIVDDLEKGRVVHAGDENDGIKLDIKIYRNSNFIAPQAEKFWQLLLQKSANQTGCY